MFKKDDLVEVVMAGDRKNAVVLCDSRNGRTKVNVEFKDIVTGKKSHMALSLLSDNIVKR